MDKISREDAKLRMKSDIKKMNHSKTFKNKLQEGIKNKVGVGKALSIVSDDFVYLSDLDLYWTITKIKELDSSLCNFELDDDFTEKEIEEFNSVEIDNKTNKNTQTVIIDYVDELIEGEEYVCSKITLDKLFKMYVGGILTCNFETQRAPIIKNIGTTLVETPTIHASNVAEIKQKMIDKKFFGNMITFNIIDNGSGEERYEYDESTRKFMFTKAKGSYMQLIDGMHRMSSIVDVLTQYPDDEELANLQMQVKIYNKNAESCINYIAQEQSGTPLTAERKKQFKDNKFARLTRKLNKLENSETNELYNKIGTIAEVASGLRYVTSENMTTSIQDNFEWMIKDANDMSELEDFLKKYYNFIISLNSDSFKGNIIKSRIDNPAVNNNTFLIYNAIASLVFKNENWKVETKKIIDGLNLTNSNERLRKIGVNSSIREGIGYRKKYYDLVGENNA